ncbi:MAG: HD domain-containing protein [Magnetococcales bacterium]|nr:HD domain-containing protein [Magnetococcales bacterium]
MVGYLTLHLTRAMRIPPHESRDLVLAALIHDLGAVGVDERFQMLEFEEQDAHFHGLLGSHLVASYPPLSHLQTYLLGHHLDWQHGKGNRIAGIWIPYNCHLLHMADRIAVMIDRSRPILDQVESIVATIQDASGSRFPPDMVDRFTRLADNEVIWLDIAANKMDQVLKQGVGSKTIPMTGENLTRFAQFIAGVIDSRSPFTATHSSGVASVSRHLAEKMARDPIVCDKIEVAGYLHDIGKLAVSPAILDKPAKLDEAEWRHMHSHTYYTHEILSHLSGFEEIDNWASMHHETLDGGGYPFHVTEDQLSLEARIIAVADVFTALTEERPYRAGLDQTHVSRILRDMVANNHLDDQVVTTALSDYETTNRIRSMAQMREHRDWISFHALIDERRRVHQTQ